MTFAGKVILGFEVAAVLAAVAIYWQPWRRPR